MKTAITASGGFGDGSSALARRPFVFLVTDGMQNGQHYAIDQNGKYYYPGNPSNSPGLWGRQFRRLLAGADRPVLVHGAEGAGATISVLYIPYNIITYTDRGGIVAWENRPGERVQPDPVDAAEELRVAGLLLHRQQPRPTSRRRSTRCSPRRSRWPA